MQPFETLFAESTRNGLTRPKRVRGNGIKMVNMGEIFAFDRIFKQDMDRVPVSDKEYDKSILKEGDLLFARQSLTLEGAGKCSIVMTDEEMTFESHLIRARLQKEIADPMFYYYLFKSKIGKELISSIVEQVAAAGIRGSDLVKLKVPVPSVSEQRKISKILSKIDDQFELNNAINKNLEVMAQALFKRWFVDFEFLNGNGEPYKSSGGEFEESELGLIPKGWRVASIGEYARVKSGFAFKSSWWKTEGIKVIKIKNIMNNSINLDESDCVDEEKMAKASEFFTNTGDILIAMTGATVGKIGIVPRNNEKLLVNQRVGKFSLGDQPLKKAGFLFSLLTKKEVFDQIVSVASGSAQPNVSPSGIENIKTILPPINILNDFNRVTGSMIQAIVENSYESKTLERIRDTILPKLMSGEIRVPMN